MHHLGQWGHRWFRTRFGGDELDVSLLLWDMRRSVKPSEFPPGRFVVQFNFSDQPASKRRWWLVGDGQEIDLCLTDPGFEVGLYVETDLRTMTRVWMGDLALRGAVNSGAITLDGSRELRLRFERWLGLSGFAGIKDARQSPKSFSRRVEEQASIRGPL